MGLFRPKKGKEQGFPIFLSFSRGGLASGLVFGLAFLGYLAHVDDFSSVKWTTSKVANTSNASRLLGNDTPT